MPGDAPGKPARPFAFTGGFWQSRRVNRILTLAGLSPRLGLPRCGDEVLVWGRTKNAWRGRAIAARMQANVVTVEDAFLRSVLTGRTGEAPTGLIIDRQGVYFDSTCPSDLETLLNEADLRADGLDTRSRDGIALMRNLDLSKYNAFDPSLPVGHDDFVLVIDQTAGDASIRLGGAGPETFHAMLAAARRENPGKTILIKSHPEVTGHYRRGHFNTSDRDGRTHLLTSPVSPWRLFEGARRVYCVTSLMGVEAILAGHRPRVFGRAFYSGWGLSDDELPPERRQRRLTADELFAGAFLLYPTWYDPYRDALCDFETAATGLAARARAHREDCHGYAAMGMRLWKRPHLRRFFAAAGRKLSFEDDGARAVASGKPGIVWASKETPSLHAAYADKARPLLRLEDGFLRSKGLGAELVPPLSLVVDRQGIYFDPTRPSDLEQILKGADTLQAGQLARAARLRASIVDLGLSKYNTGDAIGPPDDDRRRILVPGQVEDDASILTGTDRVRTNLALLQAVRAENPDAFIAYKPHPDVEAGLRQGDIPPDDVARLADTVWRKSDAATAIMAVDEVWTMTSLMGFEALMRGRKVITFGVPFYAGWGLTEDRGVVPDRRAASVSLDALVHAVLIDYPRYYDPLTRLACPPEVAVMRLASGLQSGGPGNRSLAKLQGVFASFAPLWR